ncbi:ACT domain-containing protein [Streptomyces sp. NPDC020707]|uniref:ACT domain-containing protein n=1 Tax=Streptomyces sp. NPDC020707 TaxID=3365084 RepID=UPI0037AEF880
MTLALEQEDAARRSLLAVGRPAAVAPALAEEGLSCDVVAGFRPAHLFVPHGRAAGAVALLEQPADRSGR